MDSSKREVIVIGAVFGILPIVVVFLRFIARHLTRQKPGIDDWLFVVVLVFNTGAAITLVIMAVIGGLGEDQLLDENGDLFHFRGLYHYEKCRYAIQLTSLIATGFAKPSILFLYRRIFSTYFFRRINAIFTAFIIAWIIPFLTVTIFQCTPIGIMWEMFEIEYGSKCIRVIPFYYALSITDALTDFGILVLPLPVIWRLQLSLRKRIGLLAVFLLGGSVVAITVVKLVVWLQVGQKMATNYHNVIKIATPVFTWSLIEPSLSVISTSMVTLEPLLWKSSRFGTRSSARKRPLGYDSSSGSHKFAVAGTRKKRQLDKELENASDCDSQIELRPINVAEVTAKKGVTTSDASGIWVQTDIRMSRN